MIKEIVVSAENDKIVAEVFPDREFAAMMGIDDIEAYLKERTKEANAGEKPEKEIAMLRLRETPFPKTTTNKIKREHVKY